jgi:hypothetical protein
MAHTIQGPYQDSSINHIYELLFCDKPVLFLNADNKHIPLYDVIFSNDPSQDDLRVVSDDKNIDPRLRLLAYYKQMSLGYSTLKKELIGVIVEVGLPEGLDVLACYNNGTARYINHTGTLLVWETTEDEKINQLIQELFRHSTAIVNQIGPWDQPRKPHPFPGITRISFLVSDGLYFGEGPTDVLFNDAMAGKALATSTSILQYVTEKSLQK